MGKKYFAWSFDDGLEQDKRIIEKLKQYNMGATFHLNSGLFGEKTYEGRINNLGFKEVPADSFETGRHFVPYVPHFRIPKDEVKEVYEGFEISSHTRTHVNLTKCSKTEMREEVAGDVKSLSELFGTEITGIAYPYGRSNKATYKILKECGLSYARIIKSDKSFRFPDDPLNLPLTCWHVSGKTFSVLDDFFREEPENDDMFFLMFAHGYEFDFGTSESNWNKFERICESVSSHDDIISCSISDALRMHKGEM